MNEDLENYRPANIEFDVAQDGTIMPLVLGEFESLDEAMKTINGNLTALNHSLTVNRHMDHVEKKLMRDEYNDCLENDLPKAERALKEAEQELATAKQTVAIAREVANAHMTKIKGIAYEVKRGLKDMQLDDISTVRVPFESRFYFYTYIDKVVKLCAIRDIPENEKTEIWSVSKKNEEFINMNFGDGTTEAPEGTQE